VSNTSSSRVPAEARPAPPAPVPAHIEACLFDVDGVLTATAVVHQAAWAEMFDAFLGSRPEVPGEDHRPFTADDYLAHVDGRLRLDGVRAFLASRNIVLAEGGPDDAPEEDTVHGLGARKNARVLEIIASGAVRAYPGSLAYLDAVASAGLRCAVVSASRNCAAVLAAAGIGDRFEARVDGLVAAERGLAGKPAPDTFLAAAADLGIAPARCAVYEDAVAGVRAGRAGDFGWVVGVARAGDARALREAGADLVVADLADLLEGT
jgi:beta-phosphoglucomutase family hydrolase